MLTQAHRDQPEATCSCCGFVGKFRSFGNPLRYGSMCPKCFSLERHRLLALAVERGVVTISGTELLHFAPETAARGIIERHPPSRYVTSSYPPLPNADLSLNIEAMDLPAESFDRIICSHVLEHVNDRLALKEMFRVLRHGGELIAMTPIVEGWSTTYENPSITTAADRTVHFGQDDHVRFYGADFRDRVRDAGFELREFVADGEDCVKYGLLRGERVFIARKP